MLAADDTNDDAFGVVDVDENDEENDAAAFEEAGEEGGDTVGHTKRTLSSVFTAS